MRVLVDRPMTIGEIADRAVTAAVVRWRALAVLILIGSLPGSAIRLATRGEDSPWSSAAYYVSELLVGALSYAAIVRSVTLPPQTTAMALLRDVRAAYWGSLLTLIVSVGLLLGCTALFLGVSLVLLRLPMIAPLLVAGAFVVAPPLYLYASLVFPVAVIERIGVRTALVRSTRLLRTQRLWRVWRLGATLFAASMLPSAVIDAVIGVAVKVNSALWWLVGVREVVVDAIMVGFVTIFCACCVLDLRVRAEGADLEAQLDAASHPSSSASPTAISPGVTTSQ